MRFADTLEVLTHRIAAEIAQEKGGKVSPYACEGEAAERINAMSNMELLTWLAACDPADDPP